MLENLQQLSPKGVASRRPSTQLLVSVKNCDEAQLAREMGVAWIDLKNPQAGSLGAPSLTMARQVANYLAEFPNRSVALGELVDLDWLLARQLAGLFPIAKVGLSRLLPTPAETVAVNAFANPSWTQRFVELARQLAPTQLVPVLYADHSQCAAPGPAEILGMARRISAPFVLIDTFIKDGRTLSSWLSTRQLADLVEAAESSGIGVVMAGSLSKADLPDLLPLCPRAIAVRGAVCDSHRTGRLDRSRLQAWVQLLSRVQPAEKST